MLLGFVCFFMTNKCVKTACMWSPLALSPKPTGICVREREMQVGNAMQHRQEILVREKAREGASVANWL